MNESRISQIEALHPDLIAAYLATGKSDAIPLELQLFLQQLQWAVEIYEHERSITRCASKLRERIAATQHVRIETRTAIARIYEALNFFHVDQNVPIKIWEALYADQFEKIAMLAAVSGDLKTQSKATERALECRRRAADIADSDRTLGVQMLISPDVTPDLLGYQAQDMKLIARKNRDGAYTIISGLPVEKEDKQRLYADAGVDVSNYEEIPDDSE